MTVILLTCSYDDREFVRVGYYVNNEYIDETLAQEPPAKPILEKVRRNILAEKPRVTRFAIKWDSEESAPAEFPPEQPEVDAQEDDGVTYGAEEEEEEEEEEEVAGPATKVEDGDADMEGVEVNGKEVDEESEAGSEDIEDESDEEDEEDLEEEEDGEGQPTNGEQADTDMDMDDAGTEQHANQAAHGHGQHPQPQPDVVVH